MVSKYSMAVLECEFSGYPKPKVRFLRGSMLVSRYNNSRVFPHLKVIIFFGGGRKKFFQ